HREQLARDALAGGASDSDAGFIAQRQMGNETMQREDARERWGFRALDILEQDLRYALRGIRRAPLFSAAVVLTLRLRIGANAAMFGVIDRLMFRPHAYLRDPGRVNRVYVHSVDRGHQQIAGDGLEYTLYNDFRRWTTSFSQYAAFAMRDLAVGTGEATRE